MKGYEYNTVKEGTLVMYKEKKDNKVNFRECTVVYKEGDWCLIRTLDLEEFDSGQGRRTNLRLSHYTTIELQGRF